MAGERLTRHLKLEGLYLMEPSYTFPAHRLAGEHYLPQAAHPEFATRSDSLC